VQHHVPGELLRFIRCGRSSATDLVDPATPAEWGLDEPSYKAVIGIDEGDDVIIEGGRPDPAGSGYIRVDGNENTVYELSKFNFERVFPTGDKLFDLPALALNQDDITRIEITHPGSRVVVVKEGDNWTVAEPKAALDVQKTPINTLVSTAAKWSAADYTTASLEDGAFTRSIRIVAGDTTRTIQVNGDAEAIDGAYARLDGVDTTLAMKQSDMDKLLLEPRDVYVRTVLEFNEGQVKKLNVRRGDGVFTVTKADGDWQVNLPDGASYTADGEAVDDLVSTLSEFQVSDIRTDIQEVAWAPEVSVSVLTEAGQQTNLSIGPAEDGVHQASVTGKPNIFEVEVEEVAALVEEIDSAKAKPEGAEEVEEAAPEETAGAAPAEEAAADPAAATEAPEAAVEAVEEAAEAASGEATEESAAEAPAEEGGEPAKPAAETAPNDTEQGETPEGTESKADEPGDEETALPKAEGSGPK